MFNEIKALKMNDSKKRSGFKKFKNIFKLKNRKEDDNLRDAIEELIEDDEVSETAAHERLLISNILGLRDIPVADVMIPRADIVAIDIGAPNKDLLNVLSDKPHNRIPVYKGNLDNILGVMYLKDVIVDIANKKDINIESILCKPLIVSPAMRVLDLLLQLRQSKVHIAFVVDEFGGIDGLITISDLVEAIVGEIDDEHNFDIDPQFIEKSDGSAIADARYAIDDIEEIYGNIFFEDDEDDDVDTLGGLIMTLAGRMPARGEIIKHSSGIEFEIIEAAPRRINRVRVRNLPPKIKNENKKH